MTINEELTKLETNISNTYDALSGIGATIPSQRNASNLASTVGTITVDYNNKVTNKPQINGVTLSGNKTSANLGLVSSSEFTTHKSSVDGSISSLNERVFTNEADISNIQNQLGDVSQEEIKLKIECNHEMEITGATNSEHFVAVPDESFCHFAKIQGHTGVKDGDATKTLVNAKCDFKITGKNLLDISKYISKGGGQFDFDIHLPVGSYVLQNLDGSNFGVMTKNGDNIASGVWDTLLAFNVATEDDYTIIVSDSNHNESNILSKRIMLTYGTESIAYQPYTEQFVPFGVELGEWDYYQDGKIYRQTSDIITLDGSSDENWTYNRNGNFFNFIGNKNYGEQYGIYYMTPSVLIHNKYVYGNYWGRNDDNILAVSNNGAGFCLKDTSMNGDVSALREYLAQNPIQIVYKLATPTVEEYPFANGYIVHKGGLQQQVLLQSNNTEALPYTITKEYATTIHDSIKQTIEINKEQSTSITDLTSKYNTQQSTIQTNTSNITNLQTKVSNIESFIGYENVENVIGLQVDYKNKTFKRLGSAVGKNGGNDFNVFSMYKNRRRCTVADDGTIIAYFGDANYVEDGSNGQVMVLQPKFYYKVVPLSTEPIETGIGYHLRKANYYISDRPRNGFKVHPAFLVDGREVNYYLMSAYEGSIYDTSASAYILNDSQIADFTTDKICSISGAKPMSGQTQNLTRANVEKLCKNRGTGWHSINVQVASAEQLLMLIEYASFDMQRKIGMGVTTKSWQGVNDAEITGQTSSLGNASGMASGTNGKVSVSYRGVENFWGNIWKFIEGVNIYGDGTMGGGQPYYCIDFNFTEDIHNNNYLPSGFTCANNEGYISAMGYSLQCDWLFMPSECKGANDTLPVGDYYFHTINLNGHRVGLLGGNWADFWKAGCVYWVLSVDSAARSYHFGGRPLFYPTNAQSEQFININ